MKLSKPYVVGITSGEDRIFGRNGKEGIAAAVQDSSVAGRMADDGLPEVAESSRGRLQRTRRKREAVQAAGREDGGRER